MNINLGSNVTSITITEEMTETKEYPELGTYKEVTIEINSEGDNVILTCYPQKEDFKIERIER